MEEQVKNITADEQQEYIINMGRSILQHMGTEACCIAER